ncbi:MAG: serpin family protein [Tannerella sp.]|jgi:serpin B|nr:serpin family protein [Tannerella sp.]
MKKVFLGMICVLCGLYACKSDELTSKDDMEQTVVPPPKEEATEKAPLIPREDIILTQGEQAVLEGNNAFAFELLKDVFRNEEEEANIFLSPLSATLALAMLNNGAAGETQTQIQTALGYGEQTRDDVNGYFQKMVQAMQKLDASVSFESANALWIADNLPVFPSFKEVNQTYFEAEARNVDFTDPATKGVINEWIAEKTHDLIPEFLDGLDPYTRMFLVNALYFKGDWTLHFDPENTKDAPFHNANGAATDVKMMDFAEEVDLNYRSKETFELVELPYGNEAFGMLLLLPREDASLASIVEDLEEADLSGLHLQRLKLRLPRFKIEYTKTLNEDLMALGMTSMFSDYADFSQISSEGLMVSSVLQKTFIEVNEEGTEAAGVTGIVMTTLAEPALKPVIPVLEFNRPFIYFIKEQSTGSVFFAGVIRNL